MEPRNFLERIKAERVFSPKEALPAPITTILVGRVINFSSILFGLASAGLAYHQFNRQSHLRLCLLAVDQPDQLAGAFAPDLFDGGADGCQWGREDAGKSESSKPTTAASWGIFLPASRNAWMTPTALSSSPVKIASNFSPWYQFL